MAKEDAKQEICQFVKKCVIAENEAVYISSLLEKYRQIYLQKGGPPDALKNYSSTNMKKFILKRLGAHGVEIVSDSTKKLVVKKVGELSDESARAQASNNDASSNLIWDCAMHLRQKILSIEPKPMQEPLSVDAIMSGEVEIPQSVKDFLLTLYTGSNKEPSKKKQRLVDSTAADMVFSSSGGKLLPGKHIALGMSIKSMTGSKTVTNFLNRFGHCVSNEKVRRIDMGLESTINQTDSLVPNKIQKGKDTSIGTAWDNFDINL